jgi:hypothetical protein
MGFDLISLNPTGQVLEADNAYEIGDIAYFRVGTWGSFMGECSAPPLTVFLSYRADRSLLSSFPAALAAKLCSCPQQKPVWYPGTTQGS